VHRTPMTTPKATALLPCGWSSAHLWLQPKPNCVRVNAHHLVVAGCGFARGHWSTIPEWVRLTEERQSAQVAPNESKRTDGRRHRQQSGINAAVLELGIDRTEAQRAVKIADLSMEAKEAAPTTDLHKNQSALLQASKAAPAEAATAIREIAERKAVKQARACTTERYRDQGTVEDGLHAGMEPWRDEAQSPVFDNTRAG
jgi:hypothetical protein